jgi:D-glycero-D-manno-heptose 1,7-bisphosphate phosphatase
VLVGDKPSDIEAGRSAGVRAALLYAPEAIREALPATGEVVPTAVIRRLEDAIGWL